MSEQEIFAKIVGSSFSKMCICVTCQPFVHQPCTLLLVTGKRRFPWHCDGFESDLHLYELDVSLTVHRR